MNWHSLHTTRLLHTTQSSNIYSYTKTTKKHLKTIMLKCTHNNKSSETKLQLMRGNQASSSSSDDMTATELESSELMAVTATGGGGGANRNSM